MTQHNLTSGGAPIGVIWQSNAEGAVVPAAFNEQHTHTAPEGYQFYRPLFDQQLTEVRSLWQANFLALIPFGLAVLIFWLPYQFYVFLDTPLALFQAAPVSANEFVIGGLGIIIASILGHELLHGLMLHYVGHQPLYLFRRGSLAAGIAPGRYLTRNQYLLVAITPLVALSVLGGVLLLFVPASIGQVIIVALLMNAAASTGDVDVCWRLLQLPHEALFGGGDAVLVYLPRPECLLVD